MDRLGGDFGAHGVGRELDEDWEDAADDAKSNMGAYSNPPPSPVGQDERRMQVRAYNHWASLLGEQNLPHIEDLEPEFLGDFGPYSVLFDFSTGSSTPTLQFIGDELAKECRERDPIETLGEIPEGSLLSRIAENYLKVVQAQGPVTFDAQAPNVRGQTIAYRGVLLPYSSDHDTIDFVYAVVNWKEVADARTADALLEEFDRATTDWRIPVEPDVEAEPAPTADMVRLQSYAQQDKVEERTAGALLDGQDDEWESEDNILEVRGAALYGAGAFGELPSPSFGHSQDEDEANDPAIYEAAFSQPEEAVIEEYSTAPYETAPKRNRLTDALGNAIGGAPATPEEEGPAPGGITTAADYGLPAWDEDEPEEDVDELVNPLADIDLNSRLLSLVNAGTRGKKTVDLATLSDTPEPEEASSGDAAKLFRPKAPSVESLFSPEPYSEEDEAEEYCEEICEEESFDQLADHEPLPGVGTDAEVVSEAIYDHTAEAVERQTFESVETRETCDAGVTEAKVAEVAQPLALSDVAAEAEWEKGADAPFELTETAMIEETPAEGGYTVDIYGEPVEAEPVSEAYAYTARVSDIEEEALKAVEEPFELGAQFEVKQGEEIEAEVQRAPYKGEDYALAQAKEDKDTIQPAETLNIAQDVTVSEGAEPESLTGLLAAVRDLSEAARNTDDLSRRALYEAVGRAFDVSIKAVIASEHHGRTPQNTIEHLPRGAVSRQGPDMALVMVRRHANGDTEVLGEVPHDSILMESAQRKLVGQ